MENVRPSGELHRQSINKLAILVQQVVDIETPIHKDEVIKRIRALWGLLRTGERIQKALELGIKYAVRNDIVREKSDFLYSIKQRPITPRRREGNPPADLDFICDEEISEGIKWVLKHQFSTFLEDLSTQVCRIFGIQATHAHAMLRIERIVSELCGEGTLQELPNKMIKISTL